MKKNNIPVSFGIKFNKVFNYIAYICFNKVNEQDIREFFNTENEAKDFIKKYFEENNAV